MKIDRVGNSKRNIAHGVINKIVVVIMPFFVRRIIIQQIGANFLGMDSLFVSVLKVLNMTELGFSSAIIFSMYEPIAQNDISKLRALLNFYKYVYRIIGGIILFLGILLLPIIPKLADKDAPEGVNIIIIYLIYLANAVVSYWLFAYRTSILNAYQRNDIISKIDTMIKCICYLGQIGIIVIWRNFYAYTILFLTSSVLMNCLTYYYTNKLFPELCPNGKLEKKEINIIKRMVKGLMINKLCQTSRNAFDSIFISIFAGLTVVAMYNNYFLIISAMSIVLSVVGQSIQAGVGNSVTMETAKKNHEDMLRINYIYMWISAFFMTCFINIVQPFTILFFGKKSELPLFTVIMFAIYFYILCMGDIRSVYVVANGLWWENRFRAITEAGINLFLNYFLGKMFGINGIILATLLSLFFIGFLWSSTIIYKHYFKDISVKVFFREQLVCATTAAVSCIITTILCHTIVMDNYFALIIIRFVICFVLMNLIYYVLSFRSDYFKEAVGWVKMLNVGSHF